jgi:hypothetical protein
VRGERKDKGEKNEILKQVQDDDNYKIPPDPSGYARLRRDRPFSKGGKE